MRKGAGQDFPSQPEVQGYNASVMLLKNNRRVHVALNRTSPNQIRVLTMAKGTELRRSQKWDIFCRIVLCLVAESLTRA